MRHEEAGQGQGVISGESGNTDVVKVARENHAGSRNQRLLIGKMPTSQINQAISGEMMECDRRGVGHTVSWVSHQTTNFFVRWCGTNGGVRSQMPILFIYF